MVTLNGHLPQDDRAASLTRLLTEASMGDPRATADLLPLVYQELRAMAARKLRQERPDQTLQATALVHEAYLRLVEQSAGDGARAQWDGRWHFFAAAAEAMRRILVENSRRRRQLKRGGDRRRITFDDAELTVHEPPEDLLALDEALEEFAREHPQKAQLVKLRYFAGLKTDEAAQALGISGATARRYWAYARAWLYDRITS
ncbi:MAG TPA: ECF-type sigma factor [Gemmataceae bacterium]|jgi:RNA polymerase sigma factor (TIGR02999 family)